MKRQISAALFAAATAFLTPHVASAALLAQWNFGDNNAIVDTSTPGVTTYFVSGNSVPGASALTITNNEARGGSSSTAPPNAPFWDVSISHTLDLIIQSLTFDAKIFQQPGLRNGFVDVRGSTNGFAGGILGDSLAPTPTAVNSGTFSTITVPLNLLVAAGTTYTARIYLLDDPNDQAGTAPGQTFLQTRLALDNVAFNGVPEPSTLSLAALAGAGFVLGAMRRRRTR
jgi:hypothetical protein